MKVDITILCDNIVNTRGLIAEHGLSILLERRGRQILFDVGQTTAAVHNALVLGTRFYHPPVILSHGHYDHTGGLRSFLRIFPEMNIVAHPDVFTERFSIPEPQREVRSVGIPISKEELELSGAHLHLQKEPKEEMEGIWTTGQINRPFPEDQAIKGLFLDSNSCFTDHVWDDVAVVVEGAHKSVLLLGCAHAGVRNTIEQAQTITDKKLYGVIGGTHLIDATEAQINALATFLKEREITYIAASHCTGWNAAGILSPQFEFIFTSVGTRLRLHI
jgi:7,8-dihydropterin-6-yl-methyl-4-(beta-D-ribofuranosyl)aminobenzene 5'-phosphate synthase